MSLKDNWNKPPIIPHKAITNAAFGVWGFMAVALLVIGIDPLVAIFVPAGILTFAYFFARLTP